MAQNAFTEMGAPPPTMFPEWPSDARNSDTEQHKWQGRPGSSNKNRRTDAQLVGGLA